MAKAAQAFALTAAATAQGRRDKAGAAAALKTGQPCFESPTALVFKPIGLSAGLDGRP